MLEETTFTIGRSEGNAFQIPENTISSRHAEIRLEGDTIWVKDLKSTNGTFINGVKIESETVIKPGQVLRLGWVELQLRWQEESIKPRISLPPIPTEPAAPKPAPPVTQSTISTLPPVPVTVPKSTFPPLPPIPIEPTAPKLKNIISDDYYCDNKGIRHHSRNDAEAANKKYLREERNAQEKMTEASEDNRNLLKNNVLRMNIQSPEQDIHKSNLEKLQEAQLEEQKKLAQFQRDVTFLEGESEESKFDYLAKRCLNEYGTEKVLAAEFKEPLKILLKTMLSAKSYLDREIRMLSNIREKIHFIKLKRYELGVVEEAFQKSKLSESNSNKFDFIKKVLDQLRKLELWANKSVKNYTIDFLGLWQFSGFGITLWFKKLCKIWCIQWKEKLLLKLEGAEYLLSEQQTKQKEMERKQTELKTIRSEFQAMEAELNDCRKEKLDFLRNLKIEVLAEKYLMPIITKIVPADDYAKMIQNCIDRFQQTLPNRCRVNLDNITTKWCKDSYRKFTDELKSHANEIIDNEIAMAELLITLTREELENLKLTGIIADDSFGIKEGIPQQKQQSGRFPSTKASEWVPPPVPSKPKVIAERKVMGVPSPLVTPTSANSTGYWSQKRKMSWGIVAAVLLIGLVFRGGGSKETVWVEDKTLNIIHYYDNFMADLLLANICETLFKAAKHYPQCTYYKLSAQVIGVNGYGNSVTNEVQLSGDLNEIRKFGSHHYLKQVYGDFFTIKLKQAGVNR